MYIHYIYIYICGLTEAKSPQNLKVQDLRHVIGIRFTVFLFLTNLNPYHYSVN